MRNSLYCTGIALTLFSVVACTPSSHDYSFPSQKGVEPDTWIASTPIVICDDTLHLTVRNGEYRINSGVWESTPRTLHRNDTLTLRVKSNDYPGDAAMCCAYMKTDNTHFSYKPGISTFPHIGEKPETYTWVSAAPTKRRWAARVLYGSNTIKTIRNSAEAL